MFKYTPQKQLSLDGFRAPFAAGLDPGNRWVRMAQLLDWDQLAAIYVKRLSAGNGAPSINARVVIGALIIKHLERKDDRGTIQAIQENPYMQHFLGLDEFTHKPVFDPSLFVAIRKRLGDREFEEMNVLLIDRALGNGKKAGKKPGKPAAQGPEARPEQPGGQPSQAGKPTENSGKLQMDATVADANIKYPTDLGLLNESRELLERIIDALFAGSGLATKPRTYRRKARALFLKVAKNKKKTKKAIRAAIRQQLGFVRRDLATIDRMLDSQPSALDRLSRRQHRQLMVIHEVHRQQAQMHRGKVHSIEHRIVSIHQPHIRPIVRGKDRRDTEFGPKIHVSLVKGYARVHQIESEAFNEGKRMVEVVEAFKAQHGHYPELVQTDGIYMNRDNRAFLKAKGIRHTGKPLGRRPKEGLGKAQKAKLKKERAERNAIEGKFGQGKRKYGLNRIMAKRPDTQRSMIAAIIFVMNILRLSQDFFVLFFKKVASARNFALPKAPKGLAAPYRAGFRLSAA